MFISSMEKLTSSIQVNINIKYIHIRRGCTFQCINCVLGGGLIRVLSNQIMPWSSCDGSFCLDQINCIWNCFHVIFPRAVYWISFIVVGMEIFHGICKYPHSDGSPVDWRFLSPDNTHDMVLLLKVMPSYCSPVPIVDSTEFISVLYIFCYMQ